MASKSSSSTASKKSSSSSKKKESSSPNQQTLDKVDSLAEELAKVEQRLNDAAVKAEPDPDSEEDRTLRAKAGQVREARRILQGDPVQ